MTEAAPAQPALDVYFTKRRRRLVHATRFLAVAAVVAAAGFWYSVINDTDWQRLGGLGSVLETVGRFAAIDPKLLGSLGNPALETVVMATLGTVLGLFLALPIAWFGARNASPWPVVCYPLARIAMTISRSVHEIVWALLFVYAVGLGALPGVCAVAVRSVGFISKVLAEAIENVDKKPLEAIRAAGGSELQVMMLGIVPSLMPRIIGTIIFEWDINVRRATVMGLVGAGGLGLVFKRQLVMYNYPGVTTVLLVVLVLVIFGEIVSHYVRKAIA